MSTNDIRETGTGACPDGLPPLREVIASLGLTAKKSLGQNFILDLNVTRRIARTSGPLKGRTVVEVGPGPGGLTRALFMEGAARVIAFEVDKRCAPALDMIAARYPGRLKMHFGDALTPIGRGSWRQKRLVRLPSQPTCPTRSPHASSSVGLKQTLGRPGTTAWFSCFKRK